jgi:uncharacterized membrane protein (DUF485 family)
LIQQGTADPAGPPAGRAEVFDWWTAPRRGSATRARAGYRKPERSTAEVYRGAQQSEAFQQIRRSYRGFAFPASAFFLGWYLLYVFAAPAVPSLMSRPVAGGPLNVAWLVGLTQFAAAFLLAGLYAFNARSTRDRAALGLRWDIQDRLQ